MRYGLALLMAFWALTAPVLAQDASETEDRSRLIRYVEEHISTPDMQIRLNGLKGSLSSNVALDSITIADQQGIWLTITKPQLVWSRSALLRGRLDIESLTAESIDIPRGPMPDPDAPPKAEAAAFTIPNLPVALVLKSLIVPKISFGAALFGLAAEASIEGRVALVDGSLDSLITAERLDGPGGSLKLAIGYDAASKNVALDVALTEPENGILANVLALDGRPPVALTIKGDAPLDDLAVEIAFDVGATRILDGDVNLSRSAAGLQANAELGGPLATIVPPNVAQIMGAQSLLTLDGLFADDGTITLNRLTLDGGFLSVDANGALLADGFLSVLNLDARLDDLSQPVIRFETEAGTTQLAKAQWTIGYDAAQNGGFVSGLRIEDLTSQGVGAALVDLAAQGRVQNPQSATQRQIDFTLNGRMEAISADDPALAQAFGTSASLASRGAWQSGAPLTISQFDLEAQAFALRAIGQWAEWIFEGQIGLEASRLAAFSGLAKRPLAGRIGLLANGSVAPLSGGFDFALDGVANDIGLDNTIADRFFQGTTRLTGGVMRDEKGLSFERLRLANLQSTIDLTGLYTTEKADFTALATIGEAELNAQVLRDNATGLMDGRADLNAANVAALADLAGLNGSGGLIANIILSHKNGQQNADVSASLDNLVVDGNRIGAADLKAQLADLLATPKIDAHISASDIVAANVEVSRLEGKFANQGQQTGFDFNADLPQNKARLSTKGQLEHTNAGQIIALERLSLTSDLGNASLAAPTRIMVNGGVVTIPPTRLNVAGGAITIEGRAGAQLNLRAQLVALPLSIINAIRPDLGLKGVLNGSVAATGTGANPQAQFNVQLAGFSASAVQNAGIAPLAIAATGRYQAQAITLETITANNGQDIALTGRGRIPLGGSALDFAAEGSAPLSLAERFVANRGTSLSGLVRFNINARGALAAPQLSGLISLSGGTLKDPLSNLELSDIGLLAGLQGEQITIRTLQANLVRGGSVSGSGAVSIVGDYPANIALRLNKARYSDGQTFATTMDGTLALTGNLARNPLLSGTVDLASTEIAVPESFGGNALLLDVDHIQPDAGTSRTLARVAEATPIPVPSARPSILQLDVAVRAPAQIFVRGRGLDAELGGSVQVRGPVTDVVPTGQFTLRRGRLSVLGQRFDLTEGSVVLLGDLDPYLRFLVVTQTSDVTATITLQGRASELDVSFSSSPQLPQDEILARIIFDRGTADLSPTQIARLASIVVSLSGGKSGDLTDSLRNRVGLDDLDVVSDSDGNAAVKAGKYISDNVYLGVEAGRNTEATINLDITENLKAKGSLGSDGASELGIFFERDY